MKNKPLRCKRCGHIIWHPQEHKGEEPGELHHRLPDGVSRIKCLGELMEIERRHDGSR